MAIEKVVEKCMSNVFKTKRAAKNFIFDEKMT